MDRVRDLVEGRLHDVEAWRLRQEADPELAALVDAYRDLDAMVEAALSHAASTLEAPPRVRAPRRRRAALVAAALVLAALGAWRLAPSAPPPSVVELRAIRLSDLAADPEAPTLSSSAIATLADWRPVEGGTIRWLGSLPEAQEIARATQRPVLLFVSHPACPLCRQLRTDSFGDRRVVEVVESSYVPVNVDLRSASPELAASMTGWPYVAALSPTSEALDAFPGYRDGAALRQALDGVLASSGLPPTLPWERARSLGAALVRSRDDEQAGRLSLALDALDRVRSEDARGAFGRVAAEGEARLAARARSRLDAARSFAESGRVELALSVLGDALDEFRGTRFAQDLDAVRSRLELEGRFPRLAQVGRTRAL